ncbi:hypothetical protein CWO90_14610 [Bradyrhizobium sp. Leo121]|nr:hypothetical protein CWO90_14610 [Bradyrhizobium sp. Leo121]
MAQLPLRFAVELQNLTLQRTSSFTSGPHLERSRVSGGLLGGETVGRAIVIDAGGRGLPQ